MLELLPRPDYGTENDGRRKVFEKQLKTGGALIAVGVVSIVGAFALGFAYGNTGDPVFLGAGIGLEVLGDILLIVGIVKRVRGNRGLRQLESARTAPPRLVADLDRAVWSREGDWAKFNIPVAL